MNTFAIEIQGNYSYIVRSFQFVAQMFGAGSGYIGLLYVLGVLGIFFGGMAAVAKQGASGRSVMAGWLINMLFSAVIILILIHNKSTVIIHDTTTAQMRSVGQIPTVMAALAYAENVVERGLKDAIITVMQPIIAYEDIGKGKGFELLASFDDVAKNFFQAQPYTVQSLENYYRKCVLKDTARNWITTESLHSTSDIWASMKSNTVGYGSVVHSKTDPHGTYQPCATAYLQITAQMNTTVLQTALKTKCMQSSDNDNNVTQKCVTDTANLIDKFVRGNGFSTNTDDFIRSFIVAQIMTSPKGIQAHMQADVNKRNMAQAIMAEKMLPRLRGMMYGMIIGIFPLLIGFMWFNPVKTVVFYFGMYLLMILWSAIDTFMDMQYQNEAYDMFVMIRTNGLGYNQMFDIPNLAADAVSLYGSGRWMALGLATAISGAITGVNTYAISQMGSQLGSSAQSAAGANAGFVDSAGKSKLTEQVGNDMAHRILDTVPNWNPQNIANQGVAGKIEGIAAARGKMDAMGNSLENLDTFSYGNAAMNTQSTSTQNQMLEQFYGNAMSAGRNMGQSSGSQQIINTSKTLAGVDAVGGINNAESISTEQGAYDATKQQAFLGGEKINNDGSITTAGTFTGNTQAMQQDTTNKTVDTLTQQQQGRAKAAENAAQAYGFGNNIAAYTKFAENGNVLSGEHAARLNKQYGTDAFAAGQTMQAGVSKDGNLNNVTLHDNVKDQQVGGYSMNGSKTTTLGDDMKAVQTSFNGIFNDGENDYSGGIVANGDGNIVNTSGQFGKELIGKNIDTNTTQMGASYNVGNVTMEQMVRGNPDVWGANVPKAVITDTAAYFANHYMSDAKDIASNVKGGLSSSLLSKIGLSNEAYLQASDTKRIEMINAAFQAKHEEIDNSGKTNQEKAADRAAYHQDIYNEYLKMVASSKMGRLADQGAEELSGAGKAFKQGVNDVSDILNDAVKNKVIPENPDGY